MDTHKIHVLINIPECATISDSIVKINDACAKQQLNVSIERIWIEVERVYETRWDCIGVQV